MYISALKKPQSGKSEPVTLRVVGDDATFEKPTLGRKPILIGAFMLIAFLCGLAAWAAIARISSAAIAPGVVAVEGERKTVQHFEGGVIKEIRTAVAQQVSEGTATGTTRRTGCGA